MTKLNRMGSRRSIFESSDNRYLIERCSKRATGTPASNAWLGLIGAVFTIW